VCPPAGEAAYYEAAGDAGTDSVAFGRQHIIPKPFDERLLPEVSAAVLEAAIASGVARLTDIDLVQYKRQLADLAHRTSL
jgi:malate dehydrogenase (oxaloacetate-decarboxylating)(NADP+)